jgi:hypothetical protein
MYVALNGENLGSNFLLRTGDVAVIGPQTVLDTISNFSPTKSLLSLHPNWNPGNILMYVVNETLYYFVPYYAETTTTLSPAMLACIDAFSQKVGYYVIIDPQNPIEVGSGAEKAYLDLVGQQLELTAEARRTSILNLFTELNYTLRTLQISPEANTKEFTSVNYLTDDDWSQTQLAITSFIDTQVEPLNRSEILTWETIEAGFRKLNFGVLARVDPGDYIGLYYLEITYASG